MNDIHKTELSLEDRKVKALERQATAAERSANYAFWRTALLFIVGMWMVLGIWQIVSKL